jgi:hypothetical protein
MDSIIQLAEDFLKPGNCAKVKQNRYEGNLRQHSRALLKTKALDIEF